MLYSAQRRVGMLLGMAAAALVVAGCATANLSLSLAERKAMRITSIKVDVSEATIWWGNAEREYLAKVQADPAALTKAKATKAVKEAADSAAEAQEIMASPEAKAYLRAKLAGMIQKALDERIKPKYAGDRPVVLEIKVSSFTVPSAAQRVIVGGAPTLAAYTYLKDARTGAELGKLDRVAAVGAGSGVIGVLVDQAFDDLEVRVLNAYVRNVDRWLAPES